MSQSEKPCVEVHGLVHRYGAVTAVDGIELEISRGTATAFVGPDGVGKSTTLALVAGVRSLQRGTIRVLGGDMASRAHRDRVAVRIAYVPQGLGRNLYPSLSVFENIDFFARLFGQPMPERRHRIARLLQATDLDPVADRPAGRLSGGMKQKVSLCCALVHDPDLLILDEPTTGVDPLSRRQFWMLIDEIRAERPEITVLAATAYMEEAERFEHVVMMNAGRILAHGPTADIRERAGATSLEEAYATLQSSKETEPRAPFQMPPRPKYDGPPAIMAEGLTCRFGNFTAVDHVTFSIARGEIFGFLGSNGCGKTTTMKMLTGLLGATEGRALLLGRPVEAADLATRMRVGYMSQSFSLYEELTVRANLELHARLYQIPAREMDDRVDEIIGKFGLAKVAGELPARLPLGVRQRLQLAAACLHRPEVLILDEPTSGVDPAARDMFWRLLGDLSRHDGVTIFVSTHFMNEAERCDRISLMHAGRLLAVGAPTEIRVAKEARTLEDAFISYLQEADGRRPLIGPPVHTTRQPLVTAHACAQDGFLTSVAHIWTFARREILEIARDRVRLSFALAGPLILMLAFGYGITFDVENLQFAVFDRDQSIESRRLVENFSGSRYFRKRAALHSEAEIDHRLRAGELRMAIDIPPGFGHELVSGRKPEVALFIDGSSPFRAETIRSYVQGIITSYVQDLARGSSSAPPAFVPARIEPRFRYNQDFRSVFALTPGCVMIFLMLFPSMLTALGVVREREVGSISNLSASPASVAEFLLGKQVPYIALGFASFLSLIMLVALVFGVTVKGSTAALALAALLFIFATTALGTLISTFVRSQVAAIIASAIVTTIPAVNFSGYLYPVAALEHSGRIIGMSFPALWFQNVSLGTFTKARDFAAFYPEYLILFGFGVAYLIAATLVLRKQEA